MKTLTFTGLLVAAVLLAAGSGVIGQTGVGSDDGTASKGSCCAAAGAQTMVSAKVQEEDKACSGGSCCSKKAEGQTLVTADVPQEKAACGSCCSKKADAATLVTTDAPQEKTCDGKSCDAGGGCCSEKASAVATDGDATKGVCPVTLAMSELPQLVYAVGEQKVCCEQMAGELAKKESVSVHYVVADKTFDAKPEAMKALVEATETMVNAYVAPKKCEVSGNTTIAGKTCSCPVETAARVKTVESAVQTVSMKYMVDGQEAACGNCAAARAKETGKPIEYVVAGETTTCEMTARLNLARAKYKAAVEAVVAAEKATEAKADKS